MDVVFRYLKNSTKLRFLIVGVINTAVGYGTFALLITLGVQYLIASTIATIVGVANSYVWNRYFTFKSKNKATREIVRFATVYMFSYLFGLVFLFIFVGILKTNVYIAGMLNIIVTTIISWVGHKNFSFKVEESRQTS